MMKALRRAGLLLLVMLISLMLSGCYEQMNPLSKNEATEAPGLSNELYAAQPDASNTSQIKATLYFRYLDEPMLAAESRTITLRSDQRPEQAILEALISGPSAGNADLRRIIPADVQVESVSNNGQVLFVTFDEAFLQDDIPEDWETDETWISEAPLLRELITQSIVASVTESYPYAGVQFLVHRTNEVQTSLRLNNEYFLDGSSGLSEAIIRDEALLLTPHNTVDILLTAWSQRNYERMYAYLAQEEKPTYAAFVSRLDLAPVLEVLSISSGSVYADGKTAVVTAFVRLIRQGDDEQMLNYPLRLIRENNVWKITFDCLMALIPET